jgi:hypothetical protein
MKFKNLQEKIDYDNKLAIETKGFSKKEKKVFIKCLNHEKSKNSTRDRLRKKLEDREKSDW